MDMSYDQLKLENQLCFPFYAISRLVIRTYQEDLDWLSITYPQYLALMVLWEHEQLSVNDVAELLLLNTNTVVPLLKRMEKIGLVVRTPSEVDQRKVLVTLTYKGKTLQAEAACVPYNLLKRLNIEMSNEQLTDVQDFKMKLQSLIEVLKQIQ